MFIEKLRINNLRCFARASFAFNYPLTQNQPVHLRLPNVNVIIGNNGVGKTTTFQALTIAILKSLLATSGSGFRTERIIRFGEQSASATATLTLGTMDFVPRELVNQSAAMQAMPVMQSGIEATGTIKRRGNTEFLEMRGASAQWTENLFDDEHPGLYVAAYGASRRTERAEAYNERLRSTRYQRIASLFESHVGLVPLSLARSQCLAHDRWKEVIHVVNELLEPPVRLTKEVEDGTEPLFDCDGVVLPANFLSDGYRLFIGWLIDLVTHLSRVLPSHIPLAKAEGIVIVDEVDLFLSPTWQRNVVESLSSTFPNIQWLCSTHSPLVAGSLEYENIFILEHVGPYTTGIRRPSDEFEGKSVEVVLSQLFDVNQPRSPELQRQLSALAEKAMNGDIEASIEYLHRLSAGTSRS